MWLGDELNTWNSYVTGGRVVRAKPVRRNYVRHSAYGQPIITVMPESMKHGRILLIPGLRGVYVKPLYDYALFGNWHSCKITFPDGNEDTVTVEWDNFEFY